MTNVNPRSPLPRLVSVARPEVRPEPLFQSGDGVQVGPDHAVKDVGDGGVVDPSLSRRGTQTHPTESAGEIQSQSPGSFGGVVTALNGGPVGSDLGRLESGRTSHDDSVWVSGQPRPSTASDLLLGDRYTTIVGSYHHPELSTDEQVRHCIDTYTPQVPPQHWAVIGDFVRRAVADCENKTAYAAHTLMVATTYHVLWCWQTAALPLERDVIFRRDVIAEYTDRGFADASDAYRTNRRSMLLRMSEQLVSSHLRAERLTTLASSLPTTPFTHTETALLRSWADGQNTLYRQINCNVLLAFGLGAGLSTAELLDVRCQDVTVDAEGVLIVVTGKRSRSVPMLREWQAPVAEIAQAAIRGGMYMFCPNRTTKTKNVVSNLIDRTRPPQVRPSPQRMRATWITTHLAANTPMTTLIEAAGVDSLEAFSRYLHFVPRQDPADARRVLTRATNSAVADD
jgi:integrase